MPEGKESELDIATVSVLVTVREPKQRRRRAAATGDDNDKKQLGFYEQNDSCERASRFLVHFFDGHLLHRETSLGDVL